ncbi:LOW QUALITY PROTEIN: D-beta-hydroxybutyrate dehydrogenase, mitochondrial [Balaenoptera musculus]|uniref:D-beta-hydroxybutyrate dehydrogenase, mitochondrial n=1 Tax=Balaenoptera musculus TaxID=9771 RepID=A0A8B8X7S8_BALMU|nr:LOW QUALITY PROTEIN: D-beta-hydroxybutyrate dehydrogenase, mitochondrial [Balaenoptera musculus]
MLTARFSRPLSQLPRKTLNFSDRVNGARGSLLFHSASFVPVDRRTYAASVNLVGSKAVLVTGFDSGFGFSLAKHLHSEGFLVFAGYLMKVVPSLRTFRETSTFSPPPLPPPWRAHFDGEFDAFHPGSVEQLLPKPGEPAVVGLVNNAGISMFGDVEFTSMEPTYKEVAEVNLWGTVRGTKSFLPLIQRATGCAVSVSSRLGRMAHAAGPPYCITRFGVEAFSDCLSYEVHPLGGKVGVVEPGNFNATTSLYGAVRIQAIANKMWDELPEGVRKDYGRKYFDERVAKMETYCNSGSTDTSPVISAVTHTLTSATPYTRYHPMDYYCWVRMRITTHLPGAISDRIYVH